MKIRLGVAAMVLAAAVVFFAIGSERHARAAFGSGNSQPPIGKECTVQFRRGDALGGAGNLPVAPLTSSINGAETSVSGKVRMVTEEWVVIERGDNAQLWIPKSSVLLLMFQN
jgi:hypothetical protein